VGNFATRSSIVSARRAWALRVLRIGGVIQACFAAFWLVRGSLAIGGLAGTALAVALLAAALAALVYGLWATADLTPRPRGGEAAGVERGVTVASVIQLVASFAAPFIVIALGRSDLVVPSIAITIGPLLLYLGYRLSIPRYRLVGWALTLSPVVCALVISGSALSAFVGLGAGALLFTTAVAGFRELAGNSALHDARLQRRTARALVRRTGGHSVRNWAGLRERDSLSAMPYVGKRRWPPGGSAK
jgi:hypothetical protein